MTCSTCRHLTGPIDKACDDCRLGSHWQAKPVMVSTEELGTAYTALIQTGESDEVKWYNQGVRMCLNELSDREARGG